MWVREKKEPQGPEQLYTLKAYLAGHSRDYYRVLEICGSDTLDTLCSEILDSFDFTHEHLYEFFMDNKMYSENCYQVSPMNGERTTNVPLNQLGLTKGQNFLLHYDFGDDWMFTIHVQKIGEAKAYSKAKVIRKKGVLEQYPSWDEDEDW